MISAILDILGGIWDFITKIFDLVAFLVNEIIEVFTLAVGALEYVVTFIGVLPSILVSALIAYVTIKCIFRLKG